MLGTTKKTLLRSADCDNDLHSTSLHVISVGSSG